MNTNFDIAGLTVTLESPTDSVFAALSATLKVAWLRDQVVDRVERIRATPITPSTAERWVEVLVRIGEPGSMKSHRLLLRLSRVSGSWEPVVGELMFANYRGDKTIWSFKWETENGNPVNTGCRFESSGGVR